MSTAETYRIIDIVGESEPAEAVRKNPDGNGQTKNASVELATWSSQNPGTAMVAQRATPTIEVEYLILSETTDIRLVMLREPMSERARSYRLLSHRLLLRNDPRVIAVTSARPGEGKTTCALNLALSIAEDTMMSVLLLEANLLRPALARVFGFEPPVTFVGDMIRSKDVGPPYPVMGIDGARLHFAALPTTPIPQGRLERTLFSVALADLRSVYDYIVIDAASVLESGDADVVGACADGVLVTARAGASRRADLRRAIDQIRPAAVLGGVLLDT